jgi:predicted transcriptional regulator of viral defense system
MQPGLKKMFLKSSIQRTRDLESLGISRPQLRSLVSKGLLEQSSRGLYTLPDIGVSESRTLAEVG